MKQIKLAVIAFFALLTISSVNAQDENNPLSVSFGLNNVDFYGSSDFGTQFKDLLGNKDWNLLPSISTISVGKYLQDGFSLNLAGSFNKIETINTKGDSNETYFGLDLTARYDLNYLFGDTSWFDPYAYLGGGYTSLAGVGEAMLNVGGGANFWFNENFGLNLQTGTKLGFADKVGAHYQSLAGLVFKFGGKDTDKDGIYDKDDLCPEVAGIAVFQGCPDVDGDGIQDSQDSCPNEPGLATLNGCPDADNDGIADKDDMCPSAAGTRANRGCPDSDGDGVVDKNDKCVNQAGPAANGGCPWPDTDGDGVLDKDDNCVNVAGVASNNGCPEPVINEKDFEQTGKYAKEIYFNTNSASFRPGVTAKLDNIVKIMENNPRAEFVIEGHTDSTGKASYNKMLSEKRAKTVMDYFISKGISSSRLKHVGYGEEQPEHDNSTATGRSLNRRVEINVTNKR